MPDPLPGRCKDSICDSRSDRRDTHLTYARGTLVAFYNMYFDEWHLIHLQDWIVVEIALLDASLLERGFGLERRGKPKSDPAFDLCLHIIGIDSLSAIHRCHDSLNSHSSILIHSDLCHVSDMRDPKRRMVRQAASPTLWKWLTPFRFLRCEFDHSRGAIGIQFETQI